MKIHDLLRQITQPGEILTYADIKSKLLLANPTLKPGSIIPSEHLSNKKGVCKACHKEPVFEKLEHGLYLVLPHLGSSQQESIHDKLEKALRMNESTTSKDLSQIKVTVFRF